jgi:hypothetical protein
VRDQTKKDDECDREETKPDGVTKEGFEGCEGVIVLLALRCGEGGGGCDLGKEEEEPGEEEERGGEDGEPEVSALDHETSRH